MFQTSSLDGLIPEMTHVLQYKDGVDDFSVFDISACYDQRKQTKTVVFSLPGIPIPSFGNMYVTDIGTSLAGFVVDANLIPVMDICNVLNTLIYRVYNSVEYTTISSWFT